jgi:hypothetical protein
LKGQKINGLGLSFFSVKADTLNGVFLGPYGIMPLNDDDTTNVVNGLSIGGGTIAGVMNGVSLGFIGNLFGKLNGVSIGGVNLAKELNGFQFGLINHAFNNRKLFRWTPIVNFNLRRKSHPLK